MVVGMDICAILDFAGSVFANWLTKENFLAFASRRGKHFSMDKISNMIISIKNAGLAGREFVLIPYSEYKKAIAKTLLDNEYIAGYEQDSSGGHTHLRIQLKYNDDKSPRINNVKRLSKPSHRLYMGIRDIFPVRHGQGILILSTPKGVMSGAEARRAAVGGEPLFEIW